MTDTAEVSGDRQRPGLVDPEPADQLLARAETTGAAAASRAVRPPGEAAGQEAWGRMLRVPRSWMVRDELPTSTVTRPAGVTQRSA